MIGNRIQGKWTLAGVVAGLISIGLAGCGGGGGGATSTPPPSTGTPTPTIATATFHVDVKTGQVTVTPNNTTSSGDALKSHVVFSGSSVSFASSVLSDQPGNTGVKVLNVSLTNHFDLPIGQAAGQTTPLVVLFSPFANVNASSDLRPRTSVSTVAGTGASGSADGPVGSATFSAPYGVAPDGPVTYVADYGNNKIRKISAGNVSTLAGSGTASSVDGFGSAATFNGPTSVTVNPVDSSVIVTEYLGNRIRRVSPTGAVSTIAGTGVAGGSNGVGSAATFNGPVSCAIDAAGNIYVVESTGQRIRRIVPTGGDPNLAANYSVTTLAGNGSAGSADGVGTAASFSGPKAIAFDGGTGLYVADRGNNKIRRVDLSGAVTTVAGTGTASSVDGAGNVATFNAPVGITYVNSALVVSEDTGDRLRQITLSAGGSPGQAHSWVAQTLAGTGATGTNDGAGDAATFNRPQFIAVDLAGNIIEPDYGSNKIREITPASGFFPIGTPPGSGSPTTAVQISNADGFIPSSGYGTNTPYINYPGNLQPGQQSFPQTWAFVVPSGVTAFEFSVSVEASTSVLEPVTSGSGAGSPTATVRTLAGVVNSPGFQDGTGAEARMGYIDYNAIDALGNVYFADPTSKALRRITPAGLVTTIAGGPSNSGASLDGSGTTAKLNGISGIAVTPDGLNVFFADANEVRLASRPSYADPSNAGNWTITTLGGTSAAGHANGLLNVSTFNLIDGLAWDDNAKVLYAGEYLGNRIRKLTYRGSGLNSGANWLAAVYAGDDSATTGASGATNAVGTNARLAHPAGLALDRLGNLYFADAANNLIRKITTLQVVTTVAGSGFGGYGDGPGTAAGVEFNQPEGLAVDASGYIYVADYSNSVIRQIDPSGNVTTVAGIHGVAGAVDGPGNIARFSFPDGICVAPDGDLIVDDSCAIRLIQRIVTTGTQ